MGFIQNNVRFGMEFARIELEIFLLPESWPANLVQVWILS